MAKSADAFRTISEVADWLETPAHVLRFWESKFTQVKPVKRAGGRRYYRPADMELLGGIKQLLHEEGMTIKGVQKLLRERGVSHVTQLSPRRVPWDGIADDIPAPMAEGVDEAPHEPTVVPFRGTPYEPRPQSTPEPVPDPDPAPELHSAPAMEVEPDAASAPRPEAEPAALTPEPKPSDAAPEPEPDLFPAPAAGPDRSPLSTDMEAGVDHAGLSEDLAEIAASHDAPAAPGETASPQHPRFRDGIAGDPATAAPSRPEAPRPTVVDVPADPREETLDPPTGLLRQVAQRSAPFAPDEVARVVPLLRSLSAWARKGNAP